LETLLEFNLRIILNILRSAPTPPHTYSSQIAVDVLRRRHASRHGD
jgi:hypothetical protein